MTDRYAKLRAALDDFDSGSLDGRDWINLAGPDTIRALLADYDRLRDALWVVTEHNALHFGESHNTVIVGRAALAQEQGESDANGDR